MYLRRKIISLIFDNLSNLDTIDFKYLIKLSRPESDIKTENRAR